MLLFFIKGRFRRRRFHQVWSKIFLGMGKHLIWSSCFSSNRLSWDHFLRFIKWEEKNVLVDSIQFLRWNNSHVHCSFHFILFFCIHNLLALIFMLSLYWRSFRQGLRKRQCDTLFSGGRLNTEKFSRIRTFFTKNWRFFIVCYKAI